MTFDLVINDGKLVTPQGIFKGNLAVAEGKIMAISLSETFQGHEMINASGKYVLPGVIDPHVHLDSEGEYALAETSKSEPPLHGNRGGYKHYSLRSGDKTLQQSSSRAHLDSRKELHH